MDKLGFDNQKYLELQSAHIRERIRQFGNKLYLEFGGKLFDDYHASRVLPGFEPDSKIRMLQRAAGHGGDRHRHLRQRHREEQGPGGPGHHLRRGRAAPHRRLPRPWGCYVGSVVITQYAGQPAADAFQTPAGAPGGAGLPATTPSRAIPTTSP